MERNCGTGGEKISVEKQEALVKKTIFLRKCLHAADISLRFVGFSACLIAASVMLSSKQTAVVYGMSMTAKYSYSPAFKFCGIANVIASASCMLTMCASLASTRKGCNDFNYYLFLHDLVMLSLVIAATSAATAIGYVGKYGNTHAGWLSICNHFGHFCYKLTIAMIFTYLSVISYLLLTVISATKAMISNNS